MVIEAVEAELAGDVSALAAQARVLAGRLDDPGFAATALATTSRELRDVMALWRESRLGLARGLVDELRDRRDQRRAAAQA